MGSTADRLHEARRSLADAGDPQAMARAVVRFHRKVDEVLAASISGHAVAVACARGCGYCCHMQVDILPPEAFTLAAWLRRHFDATRLAGVIERLRANARHTRAVNRGAQARHIPCACWSGQCLHAYEAAPASAALHSPNLRTARARSPHPEIRPETRARACVHTRK